MHDSSQNAEGTEVRSAQTRKRKGWSIALVCVVILASAVFILAADPFRENAELAKEYRTRAHAQSSFLTPEITIEDSAYILVDGAVRDTTGVRASTSTALTYLRTADYVIRTRLDPIMALPNTDTTQLKRAVEDLAAYVDTLAPHFTEQEMAYIKETLHPITFLRTLPQLEEARRTLEDHPSPSAVRTYDAALTSSLESYNEFLVTLERTLPNIEAIAKQRESTSDRKKRNGVYYTLPGGNTSIHHVRKVITSLSAQAAYLLEERARRITCFEGSFSSCPSLDETLNRATRVSLSIDHTTTEGQRALTQQESETRALLSEWFLNGDDFEVIPTEHDGIILTNDSCMPERGSASFVAWREEHSDGVYSIGYMPLRDLYFYQTQRGIELGSTAFFETVRDFGLPYLQQSLGNLYMCPDNGAVLARLNTLAHIQTRLQNDPIFSDIESAQDASTETARLAEQERSIIQNTVVSETEIATYLEDAGRLLRVFGEERLAKAIGEHRVRSIEQLLLTARARSSDFDRVVTGVTHMNEALPHLLENGATILIDYLYINRSAYMSLLLGSNDTVVGSDISFFADRNAPTLFEYGLYGYHSDLKDEYSPEEILDFLFRTDDFYRE